MFFVANREVQTDLQNQKVMPIPDDFGPKFIREIILIDCWQFDKHQRKSFHEIRIKLEEFINPSPSQPRKEKSGSGYDLSPDAIQEGYELTKDPGNGYESTPKEDPKGNDYELANE